MAEMQFIEAFEKDASVTSFFLVTDAQVRVAKNKSKYLCLRLQDRTGEVDARQWGLPNTYTGDEIPIGCTVKVAGTVSEWNDEWQIKVDKIRATTANDGVADEDLFPRSKREPKEMLDELHNLWAFNIPHNSPLSFLLFHISEKNHQQILAAPAAKSKHHDYIGGLLEHVLSMSHAVIKLADHYALDKPLMLAGVALHDIGKVRELTYPIKGYSLEGTLIGHISIGMQMVVEAMSEIGNFPQQLKIAVLHLIASHHGLLEWGSPKVPLMREAIVLHFVDMVDSRLAICNRAIAGGLNKEGLTAWVKEINGPLYSYREEEELANSGAGEAAVV